MVSGIRFGADRSETQVDTVFRAYSKRIARCLRMYGVRQHSRFTSRAIVDAAREV